MIIPQRIFDYSIKASSSTDELLTLGRLFSEVGRYASTILQGGNPRLAKICSARFRKIEKELIRRNVIKSIDEIFQIPSHDLCYTDLTILSINELEKLYRQRPLRIEARIAEGREHYTLYLESKIVRELQNRSAADFSQQLMIDYCRIIYDIEMRNMADMLTLPVGERHDILFNQSSELSDLINAIDLYRNPRTFTQRERLIESVDLAIDILNEAKDIQPFAHLAAQLVELNRKGTVKSPAWVYQFLNEALSQWRKTPQVSDTEMIFPLLTVALIEKNWTLQRKAQSIINRCYRTCIEAHPTPVDLQVVTTYSSYITSFSSHRLSMINQSTH